MSRQLRILVADDALDNRLIIEAYLEASRHVLTFAENGREAVTAFQQSAFDLVLMDLRMPVMDGLSATRAIREFERRESRPVTPVIALSADACSTDIKESAEAGCQCHLTKPVTPMNLHAALARYAELPVDTAAEEIELLEQVKALIPMYLAEREQDLAAIPYLLDSDNFAALRTIGHNMKGNGLLFGAVEISRIGGEIEAAAISCDRETILRSRDDLLLILTSAQTELVPVSGAGARP